MNLKKCSYEHFANIYQNQSINSLQGKLWPVVLFAFDLIYRNVKHMCKSTEPFETSIGCGF